MTGTAKITHGSKTVKSWKLTSSTQKLVWNGRIGTKVAPGSYTFQASEHGADGVTHSTSAKITVSGKKLVYHSVTVHRTATTLHSVKAYGAKKGTCRAVGTSLRCSGTTGATSKHASLVASTSVTAPKAVRASTKYIAPTVRVTLSTTARHGSSTWAYTSGGTKSVKLTKGSHRGAALKATGKAASVKLQLRLGNHATTTAKSFTLVYRYATLK